MKMFAIHGWTMIIFPIVPIDDRNACKHTHNYMLVLSCAHFLCQFIMFILFLNQQQRKTMSVILCDVISARSLTHSRPKKIQNTHSWILISSLSMLNDFQRKLKSIYELILFAFNRIQCLLFFLLKSDHWIIKLKVKKKYVTK